MPKPAKLFCGDANDTSHASNGKLSKARQALVLKPSPTTTTTMIHSPAMMTSMSSSSSQLSSSISSVTQANNSSNATPQTLQLAKTTIRISLKNTAPLGNNNVQHRAGNLQGKENIPQRIGSKTTLNEQFPSAASAATALHSSSSTSLYATPIPIRAPVNQQAIISISDDDDDEEEANSESSIDMLYDDDDDGVCLFVRYVLLSDVLLLSFIADTLDFDRNSVAMVSTNNSNNNNSNGHHSAPVSNKKSLFLAKLIPLRSDFSDDALDDDDENENGDFGESSSEEAATKNTRKGARRAKSKSGKSVVCLFVWLFVFFFFFFFFFFVVGVCFFFFIVFF
jgi:hypothetical protein